MKSALMTIFIMTAIYGHANNTHDKKRDTIYTNVSTLLNVLNTTKKKSATYYLVLKTNDSSQVKVRIDFERLKADIPLYASNTTDFDIKKLLSLKKDDVDEATKKLEDFDAKAKKQISLVNEFKALEKELANLKAVDSINIDSIAIANTAEKIKIKKNEASQLKKEYDKLFTEYKELQNSLIGNLRSDYQNRITKAIEEAYEKLENKETKFQTFDDDAWLYDIRINLVKVDATRKMKVEYRKNGGGIATEDISAGKTYFISHFAEFGAFYEEEQLISIFNTIKTSEVKRNPYLLDKPFALVTDNKDLTQHYINTVIDYKNYKGEVEEGEEKPLPGDPLIEMRIVHNNSAPNSGGKFGCSRVGTGCNASSIPNLPKFIGKDKVHAGIDLYAPLNTKIYAMFDGVVEKIEKNVPPNIRGNKGDFGNRIRIKSTSKQHKKNNKTIYIYYTHLNKVEDIKEGASIKQGDLLGLTGRTGNAHNIEVWRYHTHINVYENGTSGKNRVDPINYFTTQNLPNKNN